MALFDKFFRSQLPTGDLTVIDHRGHEYRYGDATGTPVRIRFTDATVIADIIRHPRLKAGEAFMDGRLVIERGDVMELVSMLRGGRPWERSRDGGGALKRFVRRLVTRRDGINRAVRAKANVARHYDIGNALYRLFLDAEHMQYSCAYWPRPGMTLEQAQTAKLAHIAAKLALSSSQRVLDIGCGWGGMAIWLARHAGVRVHGITLSEEQVTLARERAAAAGVADRVSFELVDYRALPARGERYDRIVSVGMFEHVGQAQFDTFFGACRALLADDGVMLLHTIGRMGGPGATDAFTRKYIFPGGYIPALSETLAASEHHRLIATDVETLRLHYALTLREWYRRTVAQQAGIEALYDPRFFRMWCFYLAGATAAFESGGMCNYQIQFAANRRTLPLTRDYMAAGERAMLSGH